MAVMVRLFLLPFLAVADPSCNGNPGCHALGLAGNCCPTNSGVTLACCGSPTPPSPPPVPPSPPPSGGSYCAIAVDPGTCSQHADWRECFEYGGPTDPCSVNINNDRDAGSSKDPSACNRDTFYLWDEPITQGRSNQWAASTWISYADRWTSQLASARARGMKITTPLLTGGDVVKQFQDFFAACSGCNDRSSPRYIDVIAFNAWIGDWGTQSGQEDWIQQQASTLKQLYGRPVYLTNYGRLGGTTAEAQATVIDGRVYDSSYSNLDRVYYFAARDYGGKTINNYLTDVVAQTGQTLNQVLHARCGAVMQSGSDQRSTVLV